MEKRKRDWITWSVVIVTAAAVTVMLAGTLRRTVHITLPDPELSPGESPAPDGGGSLNVVEVTPETVQAAVATLSRPSAYRRTVTVEQFWNGGSGSCDITAAVSGPWTRTDRTLADGRTRHTVSGEGRTAVWYNGETDAYIAPEGSFGPDSEQSIPTYEDVLALPVSSIAAAGYEAVPGGGNCIYVETAADAAGYVLRCWISVDSGLLAAAEKLQDGRTVYRMTALSLDGEEPSAGDFLLPDGRSLA